MEAREKLERFSKEVIFDAALASKAVVSDEEELESGTVIVVLSGDRLSLIQSELPQKSCVFKSMHARWKT